MKYISRLTALLLALSMLLSCAGAEMAIDDLTEGQLNALYTSTGEDTYINWGSGVLGASAELTAFSDVTDKTGYTFQWYDADGNAVAATSDSAPYTLAVTYTLAEQSFYCIATDADGAQYKSEVNVVGAAQTTVMDDYLNYLYDEEFYDADGNRSFEATYQMMFTTWNVTVEGGNLAQLICEAWYAEKEESWFDDSLFCSCVITGAATADFCMLAPGAEHIGTCGWYTTTRVLQDETTGITVTGDIPADVTLKVTGATGEMPVMDTRHFDALQNYPIITGYNISLENPDGSEYSVPEGSSVTVTIPNAWLSDMENPVVDVYHVKDDGDVVYLTSQLEEVELQDDGSASFQTDGFSDFWVTSGSQWVAYFENGESHTLYMAPGTEAQVGQYKWLYEQQPGNSWLRAESTNPDVVSVRVEDWMVYITLSEDAVADETTPLATVTVSWHGWDWERSATVQVYAISAEDAADKQYANKFVNSAYPVQIAIRNDGVLPSEPSIYDSSPYTYFKSDLTIGSPTDYYRSTAEWTIDSDILNHEKFYYVSPKGQPVIGMYDATGEACLQFLTGIDWDKILTEVLKKDDIKYSYRDGNGVLHHENVKAEDKDKYMIIPYVVKCQETDGKGWHIDCAVVLKDSVTLFYDFNLPDGIAIKDPSSDQKIGLPNNERGVSPAKFEVGQINNMLVAEDGSKYIEAEPDYKLTFLGWNTKADGSGTMYQPGSDITINEDTTLYAIWSITPEIGTGNLRIRKVVSGEAVENESFTFEIEIPEKEGEADKTYEYVLYGADNVAVKDAEGKATTGTVQNGSTFTLADGQYVIISGLPIAEKAEGSDAYTPNITVTELNAGDYTPAWTGGSASGASVSVAVLDGRLSEVVCTNTKGGETATLTVTKSGMANGESAIFEVKLSTGTFMVVLNDENPSAKILNVPIGSTYTVKEMTDWSWRYEVDEKSKSGTIVAGENLVEFTNTRKTSQWLGDESWVENNATKGEQTGNLNNQ